MDVKGWDAAETSTGLDGWSSEDNVLDAGHTPQSPTPRTPPVNDANSCSVDSEGGQAYPLELASKRKHPGDPKQRESLNERKKRKRIGEGETEKEDCGEHGESRSAVASRKLKESLKSGQFVADERRQEVFEEKCRKMGGGVKFRYGEKWEVLHQKCGKWLVMNEPYNATRFKSHLKTCPAGNTKGHNSSISDFFQLQANPAEVRVSTSRSMRPPIVMAQKHINIGSCPLKVDLKTPPIIAESLPCLGLREDHDARIPKYISRALTEGAGSQSESRIATKLFGDGTKYSELGDKAKELVQAAQIHSRAWTINRELRAIYSTNCRKTVDAKSVESACSKCLGVLRLKAFKKALSIEVVPMASKKFIAHRWRNAATDMAINLAEINGLPGLLEAVSLVTEFYLSIVDWKNQLGLRAI